MKKLILVLLILGISIIISLPVMATPKTTFGFESDPPPHQQMDGKIIMETTGPITFSISPGYSRNERVAGIRISLNGKEIASLKSSPYTCTFHIDAGRENLLEARIVYIDNTSGKIREEHCVGKIELRGASDHIISTSVSVPVPVMAHRTTFNLSPLYQEMEERTIVETTGPITFSISPGYGPNERVAGIRISLNGKEIADFKTPPYSCSFYIDAGGLNTLEALIQYKDTAGKIRKERYVRQIELKGAGDRIVSTVSPPPVPSVSEPAEKEKKRTLGTRLAFIIIGGVLYYIGKNKEDAIDEAMVNIPDYYGGAWWDKDYVGDKTSAYLLQGLGGGLVFYGIFGDF